MDAIGGKYRSENYTVVLLGDDLYSRQPVCKHTLSSGYSFIYVCKTSSHKYLYEWVNEFSAEELHESCDRKWNGKERVIYRYRYCNDVPLKDGDEAMRVNWMELTILSKDGKVKKQFSFVTDLPITDKNIKNMIAYGRSRWKRENENNNILKTKGYHLEHNFGHGKEHLSNFMKVGTTSFLLGRPVGTPVYDNQPLQR